MEPVYKKDNWDYLGNSSSSSDYYVWQNNLRAIISRNEEFESSSLDDKYTWIRETIGTGNSSCELSMSGDLDQTIYPDEEIRSSDSKLKKITKSVEEVIDLAKKVNDVERQKSNASSSRGEIVNCRSVDHFSGVIKS